MFESPRISWEVRLRSKARDVSPEKKLAGREKIECGSRGELMLWWPLWCVGNQVFIIYGNWLVYGIYFSYGIDLLPLSKLTIDKGFY